MNLEEKTLKKELKFDGKILKLYHDKVSLPDGKSAMREYVRHVGGAAALYIKDGKVALVKQYRYAYGKSIYEIPAGKMDENETPLCAAVRELEEETGYKASDARLLFSLYPSPGYTDEIIHVFMVSSAEFVGEKRDEGEFLNVEFKDLGEVKKMIESGEICDAKTVSAIYAYLAIK